MSFGDSTDSTAAFAGESKHENMKRFVRAVREYLANRTEDSANLINRHLQVCTRT